MCPIINLYIYIYYLITYPMTSGGRRGAIIAFETTFRHLLRSPASLRVSAELKFVHSEILCSHRFR